MQSGSARIGRSKSNPHLSQVVHLVQEHVCVVEALQQVVDSVLTVHIFIVAIEDWGRSLVELVGLCIEFSGSCIKCLVVQPIIGSIEVGDKSLTLALFESNDKKFK